MQAPMKLDNVEDVLQEVERILAPTGGELRPWLFQEILLNALKFKRDELDTLDLKIINRALDEFRYAARVFKPYRQIRKVSIFGSARTPEDDPYYHAAAELARMMAEREFMVITGAADGIMKAGNVGAGAENSFGANILLPQEQGANEVIVDDPKLITFRYFFIRKLFFLMEAHAFALFPGGFGTHDENFETLTLIQTGKAPPMPVVLVELPDEDYWESWDHFVQQQMLRRGLISPEDLSLYRIVHSPEEGVEQICHFYSTYHSMRWVRNRLVIRLERELAPEQIAELNRSFQDIIREGRITTTGPARVEADEPDLLTLPRLAFSYTDRSSGRLIELIWRINEMGSELEPTA